MDKPNKQLYIKPLVLGHQPIQFETVISKQESSLTPPPKKSKDWTSPDTYPTPYNSTIPIQPVQTSYEPLLPTIFDHPTQPSHTSPLELTNSSSGKNNTGVDSTSPHESNNGSPFFLVLSHQQAGGNQSLLDSGDMDEDLDHSVSSNVFLLEKSHSATLGLDLIPLTEEFRVGQSQMEGNTESTFYLPGWEALILTSVSGVTMWLMIRKKLRELWCSSVV